MPGNTFGKLFRITTFGESHGGGVGVIIDGCPAGISLDTDDIQPDLDRRKPGQSKITTPRNEKDQIHIKSGVFDGKTTGTPIMLMANNLDVRSQDYNDLKKVYRPSHADYTYVAKYGSRDWRGSGRASARETLARVAAGAVAKKVLKTFTDISILSYVHQVGDLKSDIPNSEVTLEKIESNIIRCPDEKVADKMIKLVEEVKNDGDSIGGIIKGLIKGVPAGLGEPVFNRLNADLGFSMLGINAVKGFDIGSGFDGVCQRGSTHNDEMRSSADGKIEFLSNNAGGTIGGISSGQEIHFRVAFKPVSTINKSQKTVDVDGKEVTLEASGRHDPCVLPRAVPIVDAMAALVLLDHIMLNNSLKFKQ